ncbi:MAG: FixH family protein [Chitinophagaceae bacterium]|nr:FixH family protein [Chitinophagaceae bacterium]
MNWFHKLMLTLTAFVGLMVYFAVRSVNTRIDLVTEQYYEAELDYQTRINNTSNNDTLSQKIKIESVNEKIRLVFPSYLQPKDVSGKITMYYAADRQRDKDFTVSLNEQGMQEIQTPGMRGAYTLLLDWKYQNQSYYSEQKIFL